MSVGQQKRLDARLHEIDEALARLGAVPTDSTVGKEVAQLRASRDQVEVALAQLDVAAAQREASGAQRALASAENNRADAADRDRLSRDDAAFWSRRFYTSLAVGNGVGFLTVSSALIQNAKSGWAVALGFAPLSYFALGVVFAGIIPFLVWRQRDPQTPHALQPWLRHATILAATFAVGLFVLGVSSSALEAWQMNDALGKSLSAKPTSQGVAATATRPY